MASLIKNSYECNVVVKESNVAVNEFIGFTILDFDIFELGQIL